MSIPPGSLIGRHPEIVATEIDGEVVLMSLGTGRTFGLDKRGSRIWELLETPQTLSALVETLVKQYETTPEQCQADVADFVEKMVADALATVTGPVDEETKPTA